MINVPEIKEMIFFENDGEIDLLTGSMAPNRFNQIVKRDIEISERNGNPLAIISLKLDLSEFLSKEKTDSTTINTKSDVEAYLVEINFKLTSILRGSDCITRVSKTGFWILINSIKSDGLLILENRIKNIFPSYIIMKVIHRKAGQDQMSWYQSIDTDHFNGN
jgi:GGDEF domain-containing protein